jgi:hypothetical protein
MIQARYVLPGLYLFLVVLAFAFLEIAPDLQKGSSPLSGLYLICLTAPWSMMLAIHNLGHSIGTGAALDGAFLGALINAGLLYLLGRFIEHK